MDAGIFSTYRQGENRVTASILAVLRSLVLPRIEFILGALLGEEFALVRFQNQVSKGGSGVPDAEITANARRMLLETKTERNAPRKDLKDQLERHLRRLGTEPNDRVLLLTPDYSEPAVVKEINDQRLVWASFADFNQAINDLLDIEKEVVSEREEFLLRELQKMFEAEGLLAPAKDVVVVAARIAWPEYQKFHVYVCQSNRAFRPVEYLAFYAEGRIQPIVPAIIDLQDEVVFGSSTKPDLFDPDSTVECGLPGGRLGEVISRMLDEGFREEGATYKVFLLSTPDDVRTITLDHAIENNLGRPFVQGQLYVSSVALRKAKATSELVGDGSPPTPPVQAEPATAPKPQRVEFGK